MQKTIDQITDNLMGLITEDLPAYTPKELLKAGVPSFIVERVRLITEDLLRAEIHKPHSIWASMDNDLVSHAWKDYLECVYSSSHVPKDYLYDTLNIVVEEVVEVLLEPRQKMADYLFRNHEVLSFEEISKRCSRLTIYKHIGTAIPMYMKKRGLKEIDVERCKKLIQSLDEKLVVNYTANDWADKLEMLFIMFGGKVEPDMFVKFFKDKGLHRAARLFSTLEEPLTRRGFIAFLNKEGTGDLTGDESDKEFMSKSVSEKEPPPPEKKVAKTDKEKELVDDYFGDYKKEENQPLVKQFTIDDDLSEKEMLAILRDIEGTDAEIDSESLNALFSTEDEKEEVSKADKSREPTDEEMKEFRTNLTSILDQAKSSFESIGLEEDSSEDAHDEEVVEMEELIAEEEDTAGTSQKAEEEESTEPDNAEDEPMWKKFLTDDQMAVLMGSRSRDANKDDAEGEEEGEKENNDTKAPASLKEYMELRAADFIEGIFKGSKKKFDQTIAKIDEYNSWAKATEYLQKEVFGKNKTDMFSEEAVEFTDYLQNYFNEYK